MGERTRLLGLWAATAALLLAGLVGVFAVDDSSGSPEAAVPLPATEAGGQLEWVLSALEQPAPADPVLQARFNPAFLEAVPPADLREVMSDLAAEGPYTVTSIEVSRPFELVVILQGPEARFRTSIAVEETPPHLISGLFFATASDTPPPLPVASWEELDTRLRGAAPEVGFLAAEIVENECRPVHSIEPDVPLSLGSAFKLYVLGAAADAVAAGRLAWDVPIVVGEKDRVHTSPETGSMPFDQKVSLQELARHMIEASDNTATDLVMQTVGRKSVESVQAEMGMAEPLRNVPFPTTRELSVLKFGRPAEFERYLTLDQPQRRAFLDDQLAARRAGLADLDLTPKPVAVDSLEWFATPADLCRAQVSLQSRGEVVRRILGRNPGVYFAPEVSYVAFKGGSEPGVLAGSWYVEHKDGRRFAISILLRNREGPVDPAVLRLASDAFRLAAG